MRSGWTWTSASPPEGAPIEIGKSIDLQIDESDLRYLEKLANRDGKESAKEFDKGARFEKWYPLVDVYRTFCLNPTRDGRSVIARIGQVVAMAS